MQAGHRSRKMHPSLVFLMKVCFDMHLPTFPVFRRLFCGEKPQRSWGKETSTSATSRPSPEPRRSAQSSRRCEDKATNWKYTHSTASRVRANTLAPWTEKHLHTWKHIFSQHITAPDVSCSLAFTAPPSPLRGLKHAQIKMHGSDEFSMSSQNQNDSSK